MRSSLKERIINSWLTGMTAFITLCVMYTLFTDRADWLSYSAMWSLAWGVGYFALSTLTTID